MYDITRIPCAHAITCIHERRHNQISYISDIYKRDKYLASYDKGLEAIKGEDFWEMVSTDELLPLDIPKKLRGKEAWRKTKKAKKKGIMGG